MKQVLHAFLGLIALVGGTAGTAAQEQETGQPKVAVYNFKDDNGSGVATEMRDMITTAIIKSGKFTVFSRDFASADEEAQLKRAGKTTRGATAAKAESVDYTIEGSITSSQSGTEVNTTGSTASKAILGIDLGGCAKQVVSISVDVVIKQVGTQETPYAESLTRRVETKCSQSGAQVDLPSLMRSVANELAFKFATNIYPIRVVAVQPDGGLVFNFGESVLPTGTFLQLSSPGEEILVDGKMERMAGVPLGRVRITNATSGTARGVVECVPLGQMVAGSTAIIDKNQQAAKKSKTCR